MWEQGKAAPPQPLLVLRDRSWGMELEATTRCREEAGQAVEFPLPPLCCSSEGQESSVLPAERGTMIIELAALVCLGMKWGRYSHGGGVAGPLSLLFLLTGHHLSPPVSGGAVY